MDAVAAAAAAAAAFRNASAFPHHFFWRRRAGRVAPDASAEARQVESSRVESDADASESRDEELRWMDLHQQQQRESLRGPDRPAT